MRLILYILCRYVIVSSFTKQTDRNRILHIDRNCGRIVGFFTTPFREKAPCQYVSDIGGFIVFVMLYL
jgi:hypothetical protein